jgi:hypothetical protein
MVPSVIGEPGGCLGFTPWAPLAVRKGFTEAHIPSFLVECRGFGLPC